MPVAALLITGFEGLPHAQEEKVPPGVQPPLPASKPSLYGKVDMGVPHCAFVFCIKLNTDTNEIIKTAALFKDNRKFND